MITSSEFDAILSSYRKGIDDAFHRGVYCNPHDGDRGMLYSAYKRGYDAGMTLYCVSEGLDKEGGAE